MEQLNQKYKVISIIKSHNLLRFFLISIGVIVGLIALSSILLSIFGNRIARGVVNELQKSIQTSSKVGAVDVSILPYFPSAAIRLQQVELYDLKGNIILEAEQLAFKIAAWKLLFGKVHLENMRLHKGLVQISRDEKGTWNFEEILKKDDKSEHQRPFSVKIKTAQFTEIEFKGTDFQAGSEIGMYMIKGALTLDYKDPIVLILAEGKAVIDRIGNSGKLLFENKTLEFNISGSLDLEKQLYTFQQSLLSIAKVPLLFEGTIANLEESSDFDMVLQAKNLELGPMSTLLPESSLGFIRQLQSTGEGNLDVSVKGSLNSKQVPNIHFNITIEQGGLQNQRLGIDISDISLSAKGEIKTYTSRWDLDVKARMAGQGAFELHMEWLNAARPQLTVIADGYLPIAFTGLLIGPTLDKAEGSLQFHKLNLKGNPNSPDAFKTAGKVSFDKNYIRCQGEHFHIPSGTLRFQQNELKIDSLYIEGLLSDVELRGSIHSFSALLTEKSSIKPRFDLAGFSDRININQINRFINAQSHDSLPVEQKAKTEDENSAWKKWGLISQWSVQRLDWEKVTLEGLLLSANGKEGVIRGNLQCRGFEGRLQGDFQILLSDSVALISSVRLDAVQIDQLFSQFENFGQETITEKNIYGTLDAQVYVKLYWNPNWEFDSKRIYALSSMRIRDGQLKELPLLYDFARYVKIEDLRNVRFSELSNYVEIENRHIYLPAMLVQSNAINLEVMGTHTFDQNTDYAVRINAGQVLANKLKKHNPNLEPVPVRRNGWFNIYYRIFGHLDRLQYKSDRQAILKDMKASEQRKKTLELKLLNLFGPSGVINHDPATESQNIEGGEYIIFEN